MDGTFKIRVLFFPQVECKHTLQRVCKQLEFSVCSVEVGLHLQLFTPVNKVFAQQYWVIYQEVRVFQCSSSYNWQNREMVLHFVFGAK